MGAQILPLADHVARTARKPDPTRALPPEMQKKIDLMRQHFVVMALQYPDAANCVLDWVLQFCDRHGC